MNPTLLQPVLDAGLYEYGYYSVPLSEKWSPYLAGSQPKTLIIAYNNSDAVFASLSRVAEEPADLERGIQTICGAFGISKVELYLPECARGKLDALAVDGVELQVHYGKVNVREVGDSDLVHHLDTVDNIGRVVSGKEPVLTVVVAKDEEEKTVTVPLDATMADMIDAAGFSVEKEAHVVAGGLFGNLCKAGNLNRPMYSYGNQKIEIFSHSFCSVDYAQKAESFAAANSCGRCTFCREGNYQLAQFLKKGVTAHGSEEDLPWLSQISEAVAEESVCSFGQESVRYLQDTLTSCGKDYEAHFRVKRCESGVCKAFTDYAVDAALCDGCDQCRTVCPANAILDEAGYIHRIDVVDCIKCGKCVDVCPQQAIRKVRAGRLIGPTKSTKVGHFRTSRKRY